LVGVLAQCEQTAAEEVACGVAARVDEQQEEQVEIDVVETVAVDFGVDDLGREIVAGFARLSAATPAA
jgi:hypothetical protein